MSSANATDVGAGLADYLQATAPWSEQPVLAELARFEWMLTVAFDASDEPALTFAELAALPPDEWPALSFRLHPSVHLLALTSNAPSLRKASDEQAALPDVTYAAKPRHWVVWRKELMSFYRSLDDAEAWALGALNEGADFTALCEGLCDWYKAEHAAPEAARMLRQWVEDGLLKSGDA